MVEFDYDGSIWVVKLVSEDDFWNFSIYFNSYKQAKKYCNLFSQKKLKLVDKFHTLDFGFDCYSLTTESFDNNNRKEFFEIEKEGIVKNVRLEL